MAVALLAFGLGLGCGLVLTAAVERWPCLRSGHDWRPHFTPTRIFLACATCGHQSPGWDLFGVPDGCEHYAEEP